MNKFGRHTYRIPWFSDDGRLAGFEYVNMCGDHVEFIGSSWESWARRSEKYIQGKIEQCTGLKDLKENLIYEGDIIAFYEHNYVYNKDTEHKYVVKFGKYEQDGSNDEYGPSECIGFYADDGGERYNSKTSILELPSEIEIIGNVHTEEQK